MPYDKQGIYHAKNSKDTRTYKAFTPKVVKTAVKSMIKQQVSKALGTKVKTSKATYAVLHAASQRIVGLSAISCGSQNDQREGATISPFLIKGKVAVKAVAATTNPYVVRVMLVKYKQCDGTPPTLADILPDSNGDMKYLAVDQPYLDTNGFGIDQAKRKFQILMDKTRTISYATADSSKPLAIININRKVMGKTVFTTDNSGDEGNNQYYLFVHTDAGDNLIHEAHDVRMYFKDA